MPTHEGEPLMHLSRISALPADAKRVLHIRSEVNQELNRRGGMKGPVDDLMIEESREDLRAEGLIVVNPIVFMFPNVVLRVLAQFDFPQRIEP